ncbi:hypothetical protein, partial [Mycoplasmopsis bovis]|uniref:hypothetical protein n=1 Tax=Mycoplasmopsis bovis TaxID=28903 RepID=UPI003D27CE92
LYDGYNIIEVNEMQFQKFGSDFYPFWLKLSQNAATVFNEKLKKEYNRDINFWNCISFTSIMLYPS